MWKLTPTLPSRDRSGLTAALNPFAFDGITLSFSAFSWAAGPPEYDASYHARNVRVSRTPEMKIGGLLGRSPTGKQACLLVPSGFSLRGPYMSVDMRLLSVSDETADSYRFEPMALCFSDPLG